MSVLFSLNDKTAANLMDVKAVIDDVRTFHLELIDLLIVDQKAASLLSLAV